MLEKITAIICRHYDMVVYLVFGVLTTVVNYIVYLPCHNVLGMNAAVSNIIAWVVAVAFAFVTNKPFVFRSHDWSVKTVIPELVKFLGTRVGSGGVETFILFVTVDFWGWNGNLWKLLTSVIVVILNYVGSKLFVFRKQ